MAHHNDELPESIRELFQQGLDASDIDFSELGCTPEEYQHKIQEALPKLMGQHQEAVTKAKEIYEREDYSGIAIKVFKKMEKMAGLVQGQVGGQAPNHQQFNQWAQQQNNPHAKWQNKPRPTNKDGQTDKEQKNRQQQQQQQQLIEALQTEELCSDEDFGVLLSLAVDIADTGRTDDAMAMYSLLQVIRPDQPQPYINNFTLVWQQAGVKVAADCYAMMMPIVQSPTFCYYAADCFEHADRLEEAQQAIASAVELLDNEEYGFQLDSKLEQDIRDYHRELLHIS